MTDNNSNMLGLSGVVDTDSDAYHVNYGAHIPGISLEDMTAHYNEWAKKGTYEKDLCPGRYNGPEILRKTINKYYAVEERAGLRILDVGAGTGTVGKLLAREGFTGMEALDPASEMLVVAKATKSYKNFLCQAFLEHNPEIKADSYDSLVVSGALGEGHLPAVSIRDMIRVVKPGGFVILVMRQEYLTYVADYKDRIDPMMEQYEQENLWRKMERTVVPDYSFGKPGVVFVYKVL